MGIEVSIPIGPPIVVPVWGSYVESYPVIPKSNYYGAYGSSVCGIGGSEDHGASALRPEEGRHLQVQATGSKQRGLLISVYSRSQKVGTSISSWP